MANAVQEEDSVIVDGYGNGVEINEYNGKYSLNAISRGKDDVNYRQWVFLSKWANGQAIPDEKRRPMGVRLGDSKEEAIQNLKALIIKIGGSSTGVEHEDPGLEVLEDNIPF